ncbi:hypothetical protein B8Y83_004743 [Salmonella enterica subsp. enterica serovar Oranienburg]|nr:hypothetical protein [Salmonella enterica subsp. enterica serovar Oranienburg]
MKKYTLPLCGLAISLGLVSSAMAAPASGTQTIKGTLSAPACTISMLTDYKIPNVSMSKLQSTTVNQSLGDYALGGITVKSCNLVTASANNSAGPLSASSAGNGRFSYTGKPDSLMQNEPLFFQLERIHNTSISDGRPNVTFSMTGGNKVAIKDGDSMVFKLKRGQGKLIDNSYIGAYSADVTFTFNYS